MKKVLLLILAALAIASFFFFTPVLLLMLGLCCVGVGIVSIIHPERMSFEWFRHPSWIRAAGSVLFLFGSLATLAGGALTDQLYFKPHPTSTAKADTEWTTVGSAPSRPMTHPASPTGGTGEAGAQQHNLLQTVKEWIQPSASSENNQSSTANTTTPAQPEQNGTSSSTSSTVPTDPPDFPGKKWDHPGNGRGNGPRVR